MKINTKINKEVNESIVACRSTLINATIKLMKQIGAKEGDDVVFDKVLILYQREKEIMRTIICDSVAYCDQGGNPFFITSLSCGGGKHVHCTYTLSIDNIKIIYDEVYKLVRRY